MLQGSISKLTEAVLASAATIAPKTDVVILTGTTTIQDISPPFGGFGGFLVLVPKDGNVATNTNGNIAVAVTIAQNRSCVLVYSKSQSKWYPGAIS